jgi:hypothetical protein
LSYIPANLAVTINRLMMEMSSHIFVMTLDSVSRFY